MIFHENRQPIIALYFEFEHELKFYNLEAICLMTASVLLIFLMTPCVGLQCVIVVFSDHSYFLSFKNSVLYRHTH